MLAGPIFNLIDNMSDTAVQSDANLERSLSSTPTVHDDVDLTLRKRPWRLYVTPWRDIRDHHYQGEGTVEKPYVVDWLPGGDAENPMTWAPMYKWSVVLTVAVSTLAVAMASSTLQVYHPSIAESLLIDADRPPLDPSSRLLAHTRRRSTL